MWTQEVAEHSIVLFFISCALVQNLYLTQARDDRDLDSKAVMEASTFYTLLYVNHQHLHFTDGKAETRLGKSLPQVAGLINGGFGLDGKPSPAQSTAPVIHTLRPASASPGMFIILQATAFFQRFCWKKI